VITPQDVWNRNINIYPYEKQIDSALSDPWTEEMKKEGRKVSFYLAGRDAMLAGVLAMPSVAQLDRLRKRYVEAGWVFCEDPDDSSTWVFQFPTGKTP
jgi:hypothetical protein